VRCISVLICKDIKHIKLHIKNRSTEKLFIFYRADFTSVQILLNRSPLVTAQKKIEYEVLDQATVAIFSKKQGKVLDKRMWKFVF